MDKFSECLKNELVENILPFWISGMKDVTGGFFGRMDGKGTLSRDAERGAILNARILWTFASAWRVLGKNEYLESALHSFRYISDHFIDRQYGGVFWSLNSDGSPKDTKKQFYAIAFMIYALAELYRAAGVDEALELAKELFLCIEEHSLDEKGSGYIEACTYDWKTISDMRLSDKDQNDAKTMNTHLHILEGYTNLYRVWKNSRLAASLRNLIEIFLDRIIRPDGHLGLFFGEDWSSHSTAVSYGHDIEASWLLCEAAEVLGDSELLGRVKAVSEIVASAAIEAYSPDGGMEYEYDPSNGHHNRSRDWWVQAETVVGCVNQFQLTGGREWYDRALAEWDFICRYIICPDGEWYWAAVPDGHGGFVPNSDDDRAGFWKCPYHNGRMCMEIIERLSSND